MKARIKFAKYGVIRFIGHLDLMRYFQKANRRAGIDISYSEGFNPHQIMSFASPLGLGITSDGEYLDISLNSDIDKDTLINSLNKQMVDGVKILGNGTIEKSLTVQGCKFSKSAAEKIEAAGGKVEVI